MSTLLISECFCGFLHPIVNKHAGTPPNNWVLCPGCFRRGSMEKNSDAAIISWNSDCERQDNGRKGLFETYLLLALNAAYKSIEELKEKNQELAGLLHASENHISEPQWITANTTNVWKK